MTWARPVLGELTESLILLRPVLTDDGQGGLMPADPEVIASVWAQMDPRSGQETIAGGGIIATMPFRFRIHYREDIDETWLLDWRGRRLQITAPPVPEGQSHREWLVLSAVSGAPE